MAISMTVSPSICLALPGTSPVNAKTQLTESYINIPVGFIRITLGTVRHTSLQISQTADNDTTG